jgi:hypothetical protein
MSEEIFKRKLSEIKNANRRGNYSSSWKPNFHDLVQGVTAASESITKTKYKLLQEADKNPYLHLLLYRTDSKGKKILRKWSEMLFRLSIAQRVIQMSINGKPIDMEQLQEKYPKIPEKTIKHIISAVMLSTDEQVVKTTDIIEKLALEPMRYERLTTWQMTKHQYIELMCRGFLNCHLTISSSAFRMKNTKKMYVVQDKEGNYGIYTETDNDFGRVMNEVKYVNYEKPDHLPEKSKMKFIMDQLSILGPRDSMLWFINEIMETLMYDFDWEDMARYAQFVYNTLTRLHG